MSEGLNYTGFTLPPSIVTGPDLARLVRELEAVDGALTTVAARAKVGVQSSAMPGLSQVLTDFLTVNKLSLADPTAREALLRAMRQLKEHAPTVHMTFAAEADRTSLQQLAQWLRSSVHPQAVIAVGLQPGLVAGVYMRTNNRVFDLSLKGALKGGRAILTKELGALRGRA